MRPERPFVVPIREMPTRCEFVTPAEFVANAVAGLPMREALADDGNQAAGEGKGVIDFYADGSHVFATGQFTGHLVVACSRCLGPAKLLIDEALKVTYVPESELPTAETDEPEPAKPTAKVTVQDAGADENVEAEPGLEDGDLDLFGYKGEEVDLEPLFRELFVLAIPYAPLCKEECQGLCPQCGTDRNYAKCGCDKPIDPRFVALKSLKLPS